MSDPNHETNRPAQQKPPPELAAPPPERRLSLQVSVESTERLDRFLADQLALSRTQAARLIAQGAVRVNHRRGRASSRLTRGDQIDVLLVTDQSPEPRQLKPHHVELTVVHEDEWLLVLDKPAGLVVHPAPGHWDDTLLNALASRGTRLSEGSGRPGIVHRLDKDTSGLMVLAKADRTHARLSKLLSQRRIERKYAALVWGHLGQAREIDAPIARHPQDRKRMAVLATGRRARTDAEPIARFELCDLVRVGLVTGRTHQIRVHLHHVGHPVLGDPVYSGGGSRRMTGSQRPQAVAIEKVVPRQALHAAWLRFAHPETGEQVEFRTDWPNDLRPTLAAASGDENLLDRPNVLEYLGFFK